MNAYTASVLGTTVSLVGLLPSMLIIETLANHTTNTAASRPTSGRRPRRWAIAYASTPATTLKPRSIACASRLMHGCGAKVPQLPRHVRDQSVPASACTSTQ